MPWIETSRSRALVPIALSLVALLAAGCATPERPAALGEPTAGAVASGTGAAGPEAVATEGGVAGPVTATVAATGTLIAAGTPVTIDLSGGAANGAPVVVLSEPTVKGLALFMSDAVRPYAATITEAATLHEALAKDPDLIENPRWLGHAVNVAEHTKLAADIIDTGLRGGRWEGEVQKMADENDRNVVVLMNSSAAAFLAAAQGGDAERAIDGLSGMSIAMDNLALAMQGLTNRLFELEGGTPAED